MDEFGVKNTSVIPYVLIPFGATSLVLSIAFSNLILTFTGLGLVFWGILLVYITSVAYVKSELLGPYGSITESLQNILVELGYKGRAIYLPPRYLRELKGGVAFISEGEETIVPKSEDLASDGLIRRDPNGITIQAPGLGLLQLYQRKLGIDLAGVDLAYLQARLPKLLIQDFELSEEFEMLADGSKITLKTVGKILSNLCQETSGSRGEEYLACPFHGSIALALARTGGRPVVVESVERSNDGRTVEATYRLLSV